MSYCAAPACPSLLPSALQAKAILKEGWTNGNKNKSNFHVEFPYSSLGCHFLPPICTTHMLEAHSLVAPHLVKTCSWGGRQKPSSPLSLQPKPTCRAPNHPLFLGYRKLGPTLRVYLIWSRSCLERTEMKNYCQIVFPHAWSTFVFFPSPSPTWNGTSGRRHSYPNTLTGMWLLVKAAPHPPSSQRKCKTLPSLFALYSFHCKQETCTGEAASVQC